MSEVLAGYDDGKSQNMNGRKWSRLTGIGGIIVLTGGSLIALINIGLTPLFTPDASFAELAASRVFAWRQGLAIVATLLLCLGSLPLYLGQAERTGVFGAIAFLLAFLGSAFMVAHEWNQFFFVRDLALHIPASLEALENVSGMTLFDISALVAVSTFTLGWIGFAASMLACRLYSRAGPIVLIAGFFLLPILGATLPALWGQIIGNLLLGTGWVLLGRQLLLFAKAHNAA